MHPGEYLGKNMDILSKSEKAYFNAAKGISMLSDHRCKLGCIVVSGHRIISSGHNSKSKFHRLQSELDNKWFPGYENKGPVHAEVAALIPLIKRRVDLSGTALYVYRESRDGKLAMARPCPRCMELIKEQEIKKICYTTNNGYADERIVDR